MARRTRSSSPAPARPAVFKCPSCGAEVTVSYPGETKSCPQCREPLRKIAQLDQLLERWFYPRRWRADLVRPSVPYLVEKLWTSNGQGERLYAGIAPHNTNYDIFRHLVTRVIVQGIDEGWVDLSFPTDPLAEDPQYALKIVDSETFASRVERLFPDVDWDETIEVPPLPAEQSASDS